MRGSLPAVGAAESSFGPASRRVAESTRGAASRFVAAETAAAGSAVWREYEQLAARFGTPDNVVTDGAVELRESVEALKNEGKKPRVFRDPKHFLANKLEALLKKDADYEAFSRRIGPARSALQQTELAHFTPPPCCGTWTIRTQY